MNRLLIFLIIMVLSAVPSIAQTEYVFQQKEVTNLRKAGDSLGSAVAMYGDFAVISAKAEDVNSTLYNTGAVYVYHKEIDGTWIQIQRIAPHTLIRNDYFGYAVSMDQDFLVIGMPSKDTLNLVNRGAAYVYKRQNNNQYTLFQKLVGPENSSVNFGNAVSIRNNILVIGEWQRNRANIYELNGQWNFVQSVTSGITASFFGTAVATNGTEVVVGADYEDRGNTARAGAAYFYAKNPQGVWELKNRVQPDNLNQNTFFGWSIAMEEEQTVISAYRLSQPNVGRVGAAYVYNKVNGNWIQAALLNANDRRADDLFGYSVAINQNRIIVGAPYQDFNEMNVQQLANSGAVYVFDKQGETWIQTQKLTQNVRRAQSAFGIAVALTCNDLLIGAHRNETDANNASTPIIRSGAGYFFKRANDLITVVGGGNYCPGNGVLLSATTNFTGSNNITYEWFDLNTNPPTLLQTHQYGNFILYPIQTRTIGVRAVDGCRITPLDTAHILLPTINNQLATHLDTMTCYVKMGEIVHFFGQTGYITTIQSMEGDLGYVTATVYVEDQPIEVEDCQGNELYTAVLNRHWKITPEVNRSANVLLPYTNSEWNTLDTQANTNVNPLDNLNGDVTRLHLTKYSAFEGQEATEDGDFDNNCGNGNLSSYQGTHGTLPQTYFTVLQPIDARYAFFPIPSFSEFWLHGTTDLIPLGNRVRTVDISCDNQVTKMNWEVIESSAIHQFVVLTSENGYLWLVEDTLAPLSTSTKYEWNAQINRRSKYIKLEVLDKYGQVVDHHVDLINCNEASTTDVKLFPNPTNGIANVVASQMIQSIKVLDINGRIIESIEGNGMHVAMDIHDYNPGVYMVIIRVNDTESTHRLIKL